jgi:hypothetical protein
MRRIVGVITGRDRELEWDTGSGTHLVATELTEHLVTYLSAEGLLGPICRRKTATPASIEELHATGRLLVYDMHVTQLLEAGERLATALLLIPAKGPGDSLLAGTVGELTVALTDDGSVESGLTCLSAGGEPRSERGRAHEDCERDRDGTAHVVTLRLGVELHYRPLLPLWYMGRCT